MIASVVAIAGIAIGWLVYERKRLSAAEPAVLAHAYYYDESISRFVAGPGRAMFAGGRVVRRQRHRRRGQRRRSVLPRAGGQLRKLQTGYVRSYALGVGLGAVALLAWFLYRGLA